MGKILWLDLETTGLEPKDHDIIQLAALIEIDGTIVEEVNLFARPMRPENIQSDALAISGWSREDLDDLPPWPKTLDKFKKVLAKYVSRYKKEDKLVPAGYFVRFDTDFLREGFRKVRDKFYGSWFTSINLDVASVLAEQVAAGKIIAPSFKLKDICEIFGIPLKAHDALEDIKATRMLYQVLRSIG